VWFEAQNETVMDPVAVLSGVIILMILETACTPLNPYAGGKMLRILVLSPASSR
jgi:hypothetical protein